MVVIGWVSPTAISIGMPSVLPVALFLFTYFSLREAFFSGHAFLPLLFLTARNIFLYEVYCERHFFQVMLFFLWFFSRRETFFYTRFWTRGIFVYEVLDEIGFCIRSFGREVSDESNE